MVHASGSSVPPVEGGWNLVHDEEFGDQVRGEGSPRGSGEETDPFLRASYSNQMSQHPSARLVTPAPVLDVTHNSMDSISTGASGYGNVVEPSQARFNHTVPFPFPRSLRISRSEHSLPLPDTLAETSPPTSQGESTEQDGGETAQPLGSSQPATRHPTQSENNPHHSDEQEGQLSRHSPDKNNASREGVGGPHIDDSEPHVPPPALPQAPANCFSREEIVNEIMDLTDQLASVALFGSIGVGKTSVALTLLHHNQTQKRFGTNRYFVRCDDLANSLRGFLERLSDAVRTNRTTDVARLRSHLESCPPLILLLDGVDLILDPLAPEAEHISAMIEEFGSYENVCLVTTSRMHPDIHGFHRVEIPTLSEDGARDTFYSLCDLERSFAVDNLIARLDFHPLSINLLATAVRENNWDEPTLLEAWDDDQTSARKASYYQSLMDAMEPLFRSPTIRYLGTTVRDALEAIATFPCGVEECKLQSIFPGIDGVGEVVDVLCKFSLIYRQDGSVKMLSPFRFYFVKSKLRLSQRTEIIRWGADCIPAEACRSFPPRLFYDGVITHFEGLPVFAFPKPIPTKKVPARADRGLSREKWIKKLQSVKRSESKHF